MTKIKNKNEFKLKILYLTNTVRKERPYLDPAVRYRCFNPASDLMQFGIMADITTVASFTIKMIENYDVFVFHKPPMHSKIKAALEIIERRNKIAIADYDDLIFDQRNALSSSLYLTGRATEKIVLDIFKQNHLALQLFQTVTVSTASLADQVKLSHPWANVFVIHNGLNEAWIHSANNRFLAKPAHGMISYFCGTKSHDHDFAVVEDVLAKIIDQNKEATLHIVGPLTFNKNKFPKSRLFTTAAVPYEELPKYIMNSYINLAPLAMNTFNNCKSGLKFFEAAIFHVPTIATPINDMLRFKGSGIFLPESSDEWESSLISLLDPQERKSVADISYEYTKKECISLIQTKKLLNIIKKEL